MVGEVTGVASKTGGVGGRAIAGMCSQFRGSQGWGLRAGRDGARRGEVRHGMRLGDVRGHDTRGGEATGEEMKQDETRRREVR